MVCFQMLLFDLQATAVGANHQAAQNILKQDYNEDCTLEEALKLAIKAKQRLLRPSPTHRVDWSSYRSA